MTDWMTIAQRQVGVVVNCLVGMGLNYITSGLNIWNTSGRVGLVDNMQDLCREGLGSIP